MTAAILAFPGAKATKTTAPRKCLRCGAGAEWLE